MSNPSRLEFLKKEAKSLLKQCRSGDTAALGRIRSNLPRPLSINIQLAEVQYALAREHGYSSWPELKRSESIRDGSKIVRREWFAATSPDIAVAHIYLRC
jgi:hypothetical protein